MSVVSIFDVTDEQVAAIPLPKDLWWLDDIEDIKAAQRRARRQAEDAYLAARRRCDRCGIDTVRPDLCNDCTDVLALEATS